MAEYHVGCGAFGIYAGTLEPKNKSMWRNKSDVTEEAIDVSVHGVRMYATPGDYIVKDTTGVCYPFVSDIFEEMYEAVEKNERC